MIHLVIARLATMIFPFYGIIVLSTILRLADGPALRPDGPRSGQSAPGGRTVRACAEQIRVPSFVLRLLAKITGKARKLVCKGSSPLLYK
jgi:hypothetical protein